MLGLLVGFFLKIGKIGTKSGIEKKNWKIRQQIQKVSSLANRDSGPIFENFCFISRLDWNSQPMSIVYNWIWLQTISTIFCFTLNIHMIFLLEQNEERFLAIQFFSYWNSNQTSCFLQSKFFYKLYSFHVECTQLLVDRST